MIERCGGYLGVILAWLGVAAILLGIGLGVGVVMAAVYRLGRRVGLA